ncbi:MAG: alpha/beta fold hydrolase [Clostridia bacterium]|nr:alpha/beta fold hydrolase [Clostridia bacterium]
MEQMACLLIHGVAGGKYQMERLKKHLNKKDIFAESITIKGHEQGKKALSDSKYYEWLADSNQKYNELLKKYNKVIIIGFSMGGLIALNIAKRNNAAAVILVNCPVFCVNVPAIIKGVAHDLKEHDFKNIRRYMYIDNIPPKTLREFKKLLDHTKRQLSQVKTPAFILQCADDDVVIPKSAEYLYSNIKSPKKTIRYYDRGGHHILAELDNSKMYDDIADFALEIAEEFNIL